MKTNRSPLNGSSPAATTSPTNPGCPLRMSYPFSEPRRDSPNGLGYPFYSWGTSSPMDALR